MQAEAAAGKAWQAERLLVQGPLVRHTMKERLDSAMPAAASAASEEGSSSERLAFLTQCLQARICLPQSHVHDCFGYRCCAKGP